mmetsp:Transcript_34702/g.109596  ORF Transcript_34702/g.109596 Transcript_34702/m.109596 type:complete len:253 (-) Transcript_34702:76-834(-)
MISTRPRLSPTPRWSWMVQARGRTGCSPSGGSLCGEAWWPVRFQRQARSSRGCSSPKTPGDPGPPMASLGRRKFPGSRTPRKAIASSKGRWFGPVTRTACCSCSAPPGTLSSPPSPGTAGNLGATQRRSRCQTLPPRRALSGSPTASWQLCTTPTPSVQREREGSSQSRCRPTTATRGGPRLWWSPWGATGRWLTTRPWFSSPTAACWWSTQCIARESSTRSWTLTLGADPPPTRGRDFLILHQRGRAGRQF